tara:strand:- start:149 stop:325 length:177 start_codon:yes stop_codon:yes gene_type:complete
METRKKLLEKFSALVIIGKIKSFLSTNPSENEIELFYIKEIMPYDKRSINEILKEEVE